LVRGGRGGVGAVSLGGKLDGVGKSAHGDMRRNLIAARVQDPNVAPGAADTPNFAAFGVFEDFAQRGTRIDFANGPQADEVHNRDAPVLGAHVGIQVQPGPQERGPVLAQEKDDAKDDENGQDEIDAEIFGARHVGEF